MICDKSLLTIAQFCGDEKESRQEIRHIHFHDNYAEACNGHIFVKAEYPEHFDDKNFDFIIKEKALLSHIGRDILVSPSCIKRTFSSMLKKGYHFLKDKIIIGSNQEGNSIIRYCREDGNIIDEIIVTLDDIRSYPNVSQIIPVFNDGEVVNLGMSVDNLSLLSKIGGYDYNSFKRVYFKIKIEPESKTAISFSIGDNISGVVMPCRRKSY